MTKPFALGLAVVSLAMLPRGLSAQQAAVKMQVHEAKPGLLAKATIKPDDALKKAATKVPGESIDRQTIMEEKGQLVYEFDFKAAGKSGVDEVKVDANAGTVSEVNHESAVHESAERTAHTTHVAGDTAWSKTKQGAKKVGHATATAADTVANRVK